MTGIIFLHEIQSKLPFSSNNKYRLPYYMVNYQRYSPWFRKTGYNKFQSEDDRNLGNSSYSDITIYYGKFGNLG